VAQHLDIERLRQAVGSFATANGDAFSILHDVAALAASPDDQDLHVARDLVIRLLEHREAAGSQAPILDALVRQLGLYPYLEPTALPLPDLIAFEAHRPIGLEDDDVVFHEIQAYVYRLLMSGESVILSAPTSFGKSLIIDALIASGNYNNVVVVVPTIALLDETRRRLSRFRATHKIITHVSQELSDRNLMVLTQERVIDHPGLPDVDLFVIDEFYKLDATADPDRGHLLNQAFYRLWKTGAQYYFLGPNINAIPNDLPGTFTPRFVRTDFATVAADVRRVSSAGDDRAALVELCAGLDEPTLIYCRSPKRTRDVARWLIEAGIGIDAGLESAVGWVGDNFDPEWIVGKALGRGIGVHHGRLPRSLAHYMVRQFNAERLRFLVCTSTLIEGVNTKAKNVIIFDNRVAMAQFDYFTFNNIRGRSGRMFEHFVGHVYLFHEPPFQELPFVDFPALTQPETAPDSLLVQLDPDELTPRSKERIEPYLDHHLLSLATLKENSGVDPGAQIALAEELDDRPDHYSPLLAWRWNPRWEQLEATCQLIWQYLVEGGGMQAGVASGKQLAFKLQRLAQMGASPDLIRSLGRDLEPDDAVEEALDFVRQWAGFRFPRLLGTLDRIQREVLDAHGLPYGDYGAWAMRVENLFLDPPLIALDEYGVPAQLARKIQPWLEWDESLDEVLDAVKALRIDELGLTEFEGDLLRDTQRSL
jgi:rhodanese-related sulfurtransferase